jgi:hypothetical protein
VANLTSDCAIVSLQKKSSGIDMKDITVVVYMRGDELAKEFFPAGTRSDHILEKLRTKYGQCVMFAIWIPPVFELQNMVRNAKSA